jgi:hypothetical protein
MHASNGIILYIPPMGIYKMHASQWDHIIYPSSGIITCTHPMGIITCMFPNGIILYIHPVGIKGCTPPMGIITCILPNGIILSIQWG